MRVVQEFYCNDCDGYFRVTLNMALEMDIKLECPNCGHHHDRSIKGGLVYEKALGLKHQSEHVIVPVKSTYSKTPALTKSYKDMRSGVVIDDPKRDLVKERWNEIYGDRV
jgi:hypothetical protein